MLAGFCRSYGKGGAGAVLLFLLVTAVVVISMYCFFQIGALGAGDVKLFGVCAGYFPEDKVLSFLFFSLLAAAVISLIKLLLEHNLCKRFCYLKEYITRVCESGCLCLYMEKEECSKAGICLAGPVLCSVLLHVGGVY